ncbi:MAG: hypothetical protein V1659_02540 [Candidatus Woesearchaeota archaeon]
MTDDITIESGFDTSSADAARAEKPGLRDLADRARRLEPGTDTAGLRQELTIEINDFIAGIFYAATEPGVAESCASVRIEENPARRELNIQYIGQDGREVTLFLPQRRSAGGPLTADSKIISRVRSQSVFGNVYSPQRLAEHLCIGVNRLTDSRAESVAKLAYDAVMVLYDLAGALNTAQRCLDLWQHQNAEDDFNGI